MNYIYVFLTLSILGCKDKDLKMEIPIETEIKKECKFISDSNIYISEIINTRDISDIIVNTNVSEIELKIDSNSQIPENVYVNSIKRKISLGRDKTNYYGIYLEILKTDCDSGEFIFTTRKKNTFSIEGKFKLNLSNNTWTIEILHYVEI